MNLRPFFTLVGITFGFLELSAVQPNVVLVITDDQGYGDLSCMGNPILKTPAIDALHAESVSLTDYHVSPTCAPTRGALMSGHYTNRAGTWHTIAGRSLLKEGELTLGEAFADGGYTTGMFGKWHLGDNYPFRPQDRGFDEVVYHGGGGVGQTPDYWDNAYFDDVYRYNGVPKQYQGYCTDVFFDEAKRFIKETTARDELFFAYISTNAPHGPFHCPDEYWKPYLKNGVTEQEAIFFGMIANVDENVGKLRRWLDKSGLAENTVFIFTTDNGSATGSKIFNAGMLGHKTSAYDGGHRVPFFVHWPNGGLDQARDIEQLTAHIDVLPTLIDLCGLKRPLDYKFDGRSLAPLIFETPTPWPDRVIITDSQRMRDPVKWKASSVMTERWRLVNGEELYDIEKDAGQETDRAKSHPEVVERLRTEYESWWSDVSPSFEKSARIRLGNDSENPTYLTCHDWQNENRGIPWNQKYIRTAYPGTGEWFVNVEQEGRYQIELRRWPVELDRPIVSAVAPSAPVEGLAAMREQAGKALPIVGAVLKIGDNLENVPVSKRDRYIRFEVDLEAGEQELEAYFETEKYIDAEYSRNVERIGAFYVTVKRL